MKKLTVIGSLAVAGALSSVDASAVTTVGDRYTGVDCRAVSGTWTPTGGNNLRSSSNSSAAICPLRGIKDYDQIDVWLKATSAAPSCIVYTAALNNFADDSTEWITWFGHHNRSEVNGNSHVWKVLFGYTSGWLDISHKGSVYCSGLPSGSYMTGIEVDYH